MLKKRKTGDREQLKTKKTHKHLNNFLQETLGQKVTSGGTNRVKGEKCLSKETIEKPQTLTETQRSVVGRG